MLFPSSGEKPQQYNIRIGETLFRSTCHGHNAFGNIGRFITGQQVVHADGNYDIVGLASFIAIVLNAPKDNL